MSVTWDILVVTHHHFEQKTFDYIVIQYCVMLVLKYKLANDPYNVDVWPNQNANRELLITLLSLSQFLHHMETSIP
jgi:hypothetical protein